MHLKNFKTNAQKVLPSLVFAAAISQIFFSVFSAKFIISLLILTVLSYISGTLLLTQIAIAFSVGSTALIAQLPLVSSLFIDRSSHLLLFPLFLFFCLFRFTRHMMRDKFTSRDINFEIIPALTMFVISYFWSNDRDLGGLNFLGHSEDNAAWLMGLNFGLTESGRVNYSPDLSWGGGPVFGVFNALIMSLKSLGLNRDFQASDIADVIPSAYGLLLTLTIGVVLSTVLTSAKRLSCKVSHSWPIFALTTLITYLSYASVMMYGHFTFLVAIWLIMTAIGVSEIRDSVESKELSKSSEIFYDLLVLILAVSAAMTWRAITPVALLIVAYLVIKRVFRYREFLLVEGKKSLQRLFVFAFSSFLVTIISYIFLGEDLRRGLVIENLASYFSLLGGAATVTNLTLFVVLTIAFVPFLGDVDTRYTIKNSQTFLVPVALLVVFSIMSAFAFKSFGGPKYVVQKFQMLVFISLIPSFSNSILLIAKRAKSIAVSLFAVLLVSLAILYEGSFTTALNYPRVMRTKVSWGDVAKNELKNHPERQVVCLNNSDLDSDYEAYTCNRILIGLQGLEGNDDYEDWTRLGMWLKDTTGLKNLPESYYQSLTFILWDQKMSRVEEEIVVDMIKSIPWDNVRAVDLNGDLVFDN